MFASRRLGCIMRVAGATRQKHTLPDLPYDYKALEPIISCDIMALHHSKHHATYVNNLNAAEEKLQKAQSQGDLVGGLSLLSALKFNGGGHINHSILWQNLTPTSTVPSPVFSDAVSKSDIGTVISLAPALRFNGGGHINHTIFWQNLSPNGDKPSASLTKAIEKDFGSLDKMKTLLSTASVGVQGSGWGWLAFNPVSGALQIATCQNQDPLQPTTGLIPLFGIDVWEHAYYLQYKNVRADYVKAIFDVANWADISTRFEKAVKCHSPITA